jgi:uncharacterized protein
LSSPPAELASCTNEEHIIPTYTTPGIYQAPAPPPVDLRLVRTDIAGFFGFAERGPVVAASDADVTTRLAAAAKLESWDDFRMKFGGFIAGGYLAYAVRGFFGTGGKTCYVVRVGAAKTPATTSSLPLPAAVPPKFLTYLAASVTPGNNTVQLDSSAVVSVGDLIAIGDPERGECLSVASIVDNQTVTVEPLPISAHATGELVYGVTGAALSAAVAQGAQDLQLVTAKCFHDGDLVLVQGGGLSEIRVVAAEPAGSTIHLSLGLKSKNGYPAGSILRRYVAAFALSAASAGSWGDRIGLQIKPITQGAQETAITQFSLRIVVGQGDDTAQPAQEEFYPLVSLNPNDPPEISIFNVLGNGNSQIVTITAPKKIDSTNDTLLYGVGPLATGAVSLQGGSDGTLASVVSSSDFQAALDVLGLVDEVAILCCPDAVGPPPPSLGHATVTPAPKGSPCQDTSSIPTPVAQMPPPAPAGNWSAVDIQNAMIAQCESLRYRVAVLDTPMSRVADSTSMQPSEVLKWFQNRLFDPQGAKFAGVYYPWLQVPDELEIDGPSRAVPPCGHVAGVYAYTDIQYGVRKPPGNVALDFITDVDLPISDAQQGPLNNVGINAIRAFAGRGIRVWGARAVSQDYDWRFIHTRRLLSMIEDSVEKSMQWTVFRPNNADLRRTLTHSLNVFLRTIWLQGGLKGTTPADGYFVKCDDTNNPQTVIDAGQLVCQVGVAIAVPMEFLVFQITRSVEGSQVVEA